MKVKEGKEKRNKERRNPAEQEPEQTVKQKKKKESHSRKMFFLFYLFIVTSLFSAGTLSKYMTTVTGSGTATVARLICEIYFPEQMTVTNGELAAGEKDIYIGVRNYTPDALGNKAVSEVAMSYQIIMSISNQPVDTGSYEVYLISTESGSEVQTSVNEMKGSLGISGPEEKIYLIRFTGTTTQEEKKQLEFKLVSEQILN